MSETVFDVQEVVTHARLRVVDLPRNAGRCALITLDNDRDHKRPTTMGPQGLASLDRALDAAAAMRDLVAIAVTGKPYFFCIGADLNQVAAIRTREQALTIGQVGHNVYRRLGELDVPSFAFINGAAMGGGTELALHCTYRTISSAAAAVSLPETFLGLVPGWGGAWLLPNLIGPQDAMQVILTNALSMNRQLRPAEALKLGMADVLFEAPDFLEQSLDWAATVVSGDVVVPRPEPDRGLWDMVVQFARTQLDERLHGAFPAPYRALDLIAAARTSTRDEGFAAEDEALADLIMGDELRASIYAFDLVQRRAKRPVGVPDASLARPVTKVGVVGAGLMASQLALLFVQRLEVPVVMTDLDADRVARGLDYVRDELKARVEKGRMSTDRAQRLSALVSGSTSLEAFADADFVIEAVYEDLDVKRRVFADLEARVSSECLIATNTSALSVTAMTAGMRRPERVVGFHFFNPVAVMPLVEIARTPRTDEGTLATAFGVAKALGKNAVGVMDAPGFIVNRLLMVMAGEILRAIDEGTDPLVADRALEPMGLPMSPLQLLQLVGPAVANHVLETLHAAFPDRFTTSASLRSVVDSGKPGFLRTGKARGLDPEVAALIEGGPTSLDEHEVRERVLAALAREIRVMLDEGVVAEVQDIDMAMILGAGWPFAIGGISPYLDRTGTALTVTGGRFLAPGVASLP